MYMLQVYYRMITNKSAFSALTMPKRRKIVVQQRPIFQAYPKEAKNAINGSLSPDPYKRPSNGYVFADMLRQCLTIPEPVIVHKDPPPDICTSRTHRNYNIQPGTLSLGSTYWWRCKFG